MFVNRILSRIPFSHLAFFFKASEFSAIVDDGEQLPEKQQREAHGQHGTANAKNDAQNVQHPRTLFRSLVTNPQFAVDGAVNERHAAVIVVDEPARLLISTFLRRCNIDIDGDERAGGAFLLSARLGEFACFERLALEARFVLSALARARWAFLAVLTRIASSVLYDALALAALTFSFA